MSRVLLVACHQGPRRTLGPLAEALGAGESRFLAGVEAVARFAARHGSWTAALKTLRPSAVVRGTSELPERRNPEAAAAKAATALGIPVYALEDFPGNFPGGGVDGLFVEFESTLRHHEGRGVEAPIHALGNPRYASFSARGASPPPRRILWAGQPDGTFCRQTLAVLVPVARAVGATVLFRAHPRDKDYAAGRYRRWLNAAHVVDVTGKAAAPRAALVATQFSSLALEASARGTPALFILLPEAGRKYLWNRTGLSSLPWCEEGAAFLLDDGGRAEEALREALDDVAARRKVLSRFKRLCAKNAASARAIARVIASRSLSWN